jgi:hypothetical protein
MAGSLSTTKSACRMIFVGEEDLDHTLSLEADEVIAISSHLHV